MSSCAFDMLILVLTLNLLLVLLCWYGVRQISRARQQLTALADSLATAEQHIAELLRQSPQTILQGQQSLQRCRLQYQQLQGQIQQARQLLSLLGLARLLWQQLSFRQVGVGPNRSGADLRSRRPVQRLTKS
jgi:predicted PurR-regulated permease PerM